MEHVNMWVLIYRLRSQHFKFNFPWSRSQLEHIFLSLKGMGCFSVMNSFFFFTISAEMVIRQKLRFLFADLSHSLQNSMVTLLLIIWMEPLGFPLNPGLSVSRCWSARALELATQQLIDGDNIGIPPFGQIPAHLLAPPISNFLT